MLVDGSCVLTLIIQIITVGYISKGALIDVNTFSRDFYPKRLPVHSDYIFIVSMCVPWELNPQTFALLT